MRLNGNLHVEGNLAVGGTIANHPKRSFTKLSSDTTVSGSGDITGLTALSFPATPDGSKKFRVSALTMVDTSGTLGNRRLGLYMGANGNSSDTLTAHSDQVNNGETDSFALMDVIVQPATGDKIGLHHSGPGGTETIKGGTTTYSFIEIVEVTE